MSSATKNEDGVNVTINTASERPYTIMVTVLGIGAVGMLSMALAQKGWLEAAATMLTMFLTQLIRMMVANGMLQLPDREASGSEFQQTTGFLKTAFREFQVWQAKSPVWRLAALAFGYTVAFMVARWAITFSLGVFTNLWVAGAAAAVVGMLIISPSVFGTIARRMQSKNDKEV